MLKKLSLLLAAVTLCTSIGIVVPVSAQASAEETVLVQSNFQNCNFGTYTEENQTDGENDLRNGIVMIDDSELSAGYTIKNGTEYESISEADIVDDDGTKVLRLNTFLSTSYDVSTIDGYPVVKSTGKMPKNGKVRIDLELKMSPRVSFWMYHSKPVEGNFRIWRLENGNATSSKIRVLDSTDTGKTAACNVYNMYTVIMDTATGEMNFYLNGEFIYTAMGKLPAEDKELFFKHVSLNDESVKPVVTYNDEDSTKIESVKNPQYVYVKSLKMSTYTDTVLESVIPEDGSTVVSPDEVVFNFSSDVAGVESATVTPSGSEAVDVKSLLAINGKTVMVPYDFEDDVTYTVELKGVSNGLTSLDAQTSFTTEQWKFSNISKNPVSSTIKDDSVYFVNEDFEASDDSNLILTENTSNGWYVDSSTNATITEHSDGTQALKLANNADFCIKYDKELGLLDNTTTLSYDVYIGENTTNFNINRDDYSTSVKNQPVATWNNGNYKNGTEEVAMSAGEWHNVKITISDIAGTTIHVDGNPVMNIGKNPEYAGLSKTGFFRFRVKGDDVIIDNLKLYLDKKQTALTDIYPVYDATDVPVSDVIELTYSGAIGDVSGAKLIVKPNDINEATVLTNGNGMSVSSDGNRVIITLDAVLLENTGYALEFSGIKNTADLAVEAIRTRFSTVYDSSWEVKDFEGVVQSASTKKYSVKVKNETDSEGARMAVAVYDENGNLKDVVFSEPAISGNDWVELNAIVNYSEGNSSKIFIWDSLENMNLISGIISD